jgi:hypothetical protein
MPEYNLKIGDKILCENEQTYTLGKGDTFYTFSIIDEFGEIVNYAHDYYIVDCLNADEDYYKELPVGTDKNGNLKTTRVLKHIPNGELQSNSKVADKIMKYLEEDAKE